MTVTSGPRARRAGGLLLALALLLVAANLRPAVVAVAPLVGQIRVDLGVSGAVAGLLTTLPVLCFGLLAPAAPALSRRLGVETLLLIALVVLAAGIALRVVPTIGVIMVGSVLIGSAIAVGNVSMPALVKRDFPHRTGLMTGAYSMVLSGGGALAAAVTVPLQRALDVGWAGVLAVWGVLALLTVAVWTPWVLRARRAGETVVAPGSGSGKVWRDRLAWQVTLFMGLPSLHFYALNAWIPTIFVDAGRTPSQAGLLLGLAGLVGLVGSVAAPPLAVRRRAQSGLIVGLCLLYPVGYVGLLVAPVAGAPVWMVVLGLAQGAMIALGLLMITLRAGDPRAVGELSGMAQGVGYVLAALGPFGLGALHDLTGTWTVPLVVMLVLAVPVTVFGALAGRARQVGDTPVPSGAGRAG